MILHPHFDINEQGHLTVGGADAVALAKEFGTPAYILDENVIRDNCRTYLRAARAAFGEDALPLLIFEQGERKEKDEFQPEEICIGDTKYLPVSFLEDYLAISQFGDHKTRSFLICANGEFATFYLNNEEVIINGEHCAMKAPALMKDGELLLPIDFYAEKMSCFELGKNNATYGADVLTFLKDQPATFSLNTCTPDAPVDYATVPVAPTVPAEPAT